MGVVGFYLQTLQKIDEQIISYAFLPHFNCVFTLAILYKFGSCCIWNKRV